MLTNFHLTRLLFFLFLNILSIHLAAQKEWKFSEEDSLKNSRLLYDEGNYDLALPILEDLYKNHWDDFSLKYIYGICALKRSDKLDVALNLLTEVYAKNKKAGDIELDLATALHYNYKFDSALIFINLYLAKKKLQPEKKTLAEQTKRYIINAIQFYNDPKKVKITNMGSDVNTEQDEYVPVITADESKIIYTYKGEKSQGGKQNAYQESDKRGKYYEDVFISEKKAGSWLKPQGIDVINTNSHDAAIAISPDGTQLFTYRNDGSDRGDIYVSYLDGKNWSPSKKLKGKVNSSFWEGSCSLTSDGQTLFFSSEKPGGYGGRDIYRVSLLADSTWGNVVNLGDSINTVYDDDAPFIHPDGVTLFFSSKGRNSMGDYDVFQSFMNPIDSSFSAPVNLGYPVNTPGGDRYYVVSADGQTGYYSSEKTGGFGSNDIYMVDPGYIGKKPQLYLVKGNVTLNGMPINSKILVNIISKDNKLFSKVIPNKATGEYLITLPSGELYKLTFVTDNFEWKILEIDASGIHDFVEQKYDLDFNPDFIFTNPEFQKNNSSPQEISDTRETQSDRMNKIKKFSEKFGEISTDGLEFKVQIGAYKFRENYSHKHLSGFGKTESITLEDGVTRITIGGNFKNLSKAYDYCKKILEAGQKDAFITAIYQGKRIYLEELENLRIFK